MKILLIIALFSLIGLLIPVAYSQNISKEPIEIQAIADAKECKKIVDGNSSMTDAEKVVAKRKCASESSSKIVGNIESKITRLDELRIKNLVV